MSNYPGDIPVVAKSDPDTAVLPPLPVWEPALGGAEGATSVAPATSVGKSVSELISVNSSELFGSIVTVLILFAWRRFFSKNTPT